MTIEPPVLSDLANSPTGVPPTVSRTRLSFFPSRASAISLCRLLPWRTTRSPPQSRTCSAASSRPHLSISVLTSHKPQKIFANETLCQLSYIPEEHRNYHGGGIFHQSIFCNVELRGRPSLGIWIRFVSQLKADSSGTSGSRWLEANQSRLKRVD